MKLWIRSQDKKKLKKIEYLYIPVSRTDENFGIYDKDVLLGTYKTKERALEVLDEIQNQIFHHCCIDTSKASIFEMPKE